MSGAAIGYVYEFSPFKGATFSVHLAIGDVVNDAHGWEFYMSVVNLSKKARVNRKTAGLALDALEAAGFLECLETADPVRLRTLGRSLKYRFLRPPVAVVFDGGVRRQTAPSADQGVRRGTAPGEASDLRGVRRDTARTKGERNDELKLLPCNDPEPVPSSTTVARGIIDEAVLALQAKGEPVPPHGFPAVRAVVAIVESQGADCARRAVSTAPVWTPNALHIAVTRLRGGSAGPAQWDNSLRSADAGVGFVQREPGKSRKLTPDEIRKVQGLDESGVGHG